MQVQDDAAIPLDVCLREVLSLQSEWTSKNTSEMYRRGQLIRRIGPTALRRLLDARSDPPPFDWAVQGRDGSGFKTRIPWIRLHSLTHSPSATEGWYLVYLFSFDGRIVYLSLNQGTAVATAGQFRTRPADELATRADWARSVLNVDDERFADTINLSDTGDLAVGYQRGNVLAIPYAAESIPSEGSLISDLVELVHLLATLYETPGAPEYSHTMGSTAMGP